MRDKAQQYDLPQVQASRGYACGIYEHRCFVAISADVQVDVQTQQIKVLRMCCVQDVGMAVNPGQLRAQVESNLPGVWVWR